MEDKIKPSMTRQESDLISLRTERQASTFPFSRRPFVRDDSLSSTAEDGEEKKELQPGELRVKAPDDVPWIDLLLEISMTTAFSSLSDGTPILQWNDAVSYVSFFGFVWWIWVSQVSYNMRFRQADWLHRIWVLAQLFVFSALSAFTEDFDIAYGLFTDPDAALTEQLMAQLGNDNSRQAAQTFRDQRLPRVNARGISMVLALSRLLLLVQYAVVYFHGKGLTRHSLLIHMGPLLFSSICFFGAFIVIGSGSQEDSVTPIPAIEIAKLVLWFLPILVEMVSHFVALRLPGYVRYSTESVYARNGTLFIIILGGCLDKITGGFSDFIGNIGLKLNAIPLFLATATIFICLFSLYFGTPGSTRELGNRRALAWFMSQGLFLAPLLVSMQAIAQCLQFSNLINAVSIGSNALTPVFDHLRNNPGVNVTAEMFPETMLVFEKLAASFPVILNDANRAVALSKDYNGSVECYELQETMIIIYDVILSTLDAQPEVGSLIWAKVNIFLTSSMVNQTELNDANFYDIWNGLILDRASSSLWLFPSAGAAVLALVVMSLIKGKPRDKWEWAIVGVRAAFGTGISLLALLDLGSSSPPLTSSNTPSGSKIWQLVLGPTQWPLIILALILFALRATEHGIAIAANRTYHSFRSINYLQVNGPDRRRTQRYQRAASGDSDSMPLTEYRYSYTDRKTAEPLYSDPFDPYGDLDNDGKESPLGSHHDTLQDEDHTYVPMEHPSNVP